MFDCKTKYPLAHTKRLGYLKNFITGPNIIVGDYTYYDDPAGPDSFETNNILYHFDFIGDKLIIGKFCQIAGGARFIMNGANHGLSGFTTYPFAIFAEAFSDLPLLSDNKGDTVVGNDVWIGYDVTIMPGITIGDGAIIASKSVVTKNIAPYTIVGGNPATTIRMRFNDEIIAILLKIQWWNWPKDKIIHNAATLLVGDIDTLKQLR